MKGALLLCIAALAISAVDCQITNWGQCPSVEPQFPFELPSLDGTWYEWQRWATGAGDKCVKNKISAANMTFNVERVSISNNASSTLTGTFTLPQPTEGKMLVLMADNILQIPDTKLVLETDYETYAIIYHCTSVAGISMTQNLNVLGRSRFMLAPYEMKVRDALARKGLNGTQPWTNIEQYGCNN